MNKERRSGQTKRLGKALLCLGVALVLSAAALTGYNWYEGFQAGERSEVLLAALERQMPEDHADQPGERPEPAEEMPAVAAGDLKLIGRLSVPALGLELPVCGQWSSENASAAPCRYKGSAYDGSLIIAGHSFREHFGTLRELEYGDRVEFEDTEGYTFCYEVIRIEQIDGRDVQGMEEGEWDLTLFTCAWDNTKRIAVRCREV